MPGTTPICYIIEAFFSGFCCLPDKMLDIGLDLHSTYLRASLLTLYTIFKMSLTGLFAADGYWTASHFELSVSRRVKLQTGLQ